jgi:CRISP-associated protein Cas1
MCGPTSRRELMEPYRPQLDRQVLEMIRSETFTPRDSPIATGGVCRLHPDLARRLAGQSACSVSVDSSLAKLRGTVREAPDLE